MVRVLRYQATPVGKKPPAPRLGACSSTGPAMDQSLGRVTDFQAESSKVGDGASEGSLCTKCQSAVNCWIWRGPVGAAWRAMGSERDRRIRSFERRGCGVCLVGICFTL